MRRLRREVISDGGRDERRGWKRMRKEKNEKGKEGVISFHSLSVDVINTT